MTHPDAHPHPGSWRVAPLCPQCLVGLGITAGVVCLSGGWAEAVTEVRGALRRESGSMPGRVRKAGEQVEDGRTGVLMWAVKRGISDLGRTAQRSGRGAALQLPATVGRQSTAAGVQDLCATENPCSVGDGITHAGGGSRGTPSSAFHSLLPPSLERSLKQSVFALLWNIIDRGPLSPCSEGSPSKVWAPLSTRARARFSESEKRIWILPLSPSVE